MLSGVLKMFSVGTHTKIRHDRGRHRWLRIPYGISPALEYFQQKLDQNLQGLPGIYRIADDVLITGQGDTKEEADKDHDANLMESALRLNTSSRSLIKTCKDCLAFTE